MAHSFGFWLVGTPNTCVFRLPLCRQRSERLFLCLFLLIPRDEPLPDDYARIPIGMPAQVAPGAEHERPTGGITLFRLSLCIAADGGMAALGLPARVTRDHTA